MTIRERLNGRLANWATIGVFLILIASGIKAYGALEQRVADLEKTCLKADLAR